VLVGTTKAVMFGAGTAHKLPVREELTGIPYLQVWGGSNQIYCSETCVNHASRKVERPTKEVLEQEMMQSSISGLGRKYKVSGPAVRKWAKAYGII